MNPFLSPNYEDALEALRRGPMTRGCTGRPANERDDF